MTGSCQGHSLGLLWVRSFYFTRLHDIILNEHRAFHRGYHRHIPIMARYFLVADRPGRSGMHIRHIPPTRNHTLSTGARARREATTRESKTHVEVVEPVPNRLAISVPKPPHRGYSVFVLGLEHVLPPDAYSLRLEPSF